MSRLRLLALTAVAVIALCVGTAPAAATPTRPSPAADCEAHNGKLTEPYTAAQLQKALNRLPAGEKEYTSCYGAISNALTQIEGGHPITASSGGGGGGGSGTLIIVIVVLVVLLGGGGAASWAYRRNRTGGDGPGGEAPPSADALA
jgi:hypothetical protein